MTYTRATSFVCKSWEITTFPPNYRGYYKNCWTNTRLICSQLVIFFMLNPNTTLGIFSFWFIYLCIYFIYLFIYLFIVYLFIVYLFIYLFILFIYLIIYIYLSIHLFIILFDLIWFDLIWFVYLFFSLKKMKKIDLSSTLDICEKSVKKCMPISIWASWFKRQDRPL